jgi:hypothetical protein
VDDGATQVTECPCYGKAFRENAAANVAKAPIERITPEGWRSLIDRLKEQPRQSNRAEPVRSTKRTALLSERGAPGYSQWPQETG